MNSQLILHSLRFVLFGFLASASAAGEVLYNGIELPTPWPPASLVMKAGEPMPVPWLTQPPAVIAIDFGRRLFVVNAVFLARPSRLTP
jgi:hypothetical protein